MSYAEIIDAVKALPVVDRLALIDEIWIMSKDVDDSALSAEQERMLDERLRDMEENPDDVVSWEEVQERIFRKKR